MLLPSLVLPRADALPGRSAAAAVMADPLTARLRKSLLVLIHVTRANADQFQIDDCCGIKSPFTGVTVLLIRSATLVLSSVIRSELPIERTDPVPIVYSTDARASKGVRIVGMFPDASHPPITYPIARLKGSTSREAEGFRLFLISHAGRVIFQSYGFEPHRPQAL